MSGQAVALLGSETFKLLENVFFLNELISLIHIIYSIIH